KPLAKALGVPYIPITPLFPWFGPLGVIPLPSKWLIAFCKPIDTANYDGDPEDPLVVFNLADEVRETIQQTLQELLQRRPEPFGEPRRAGPARSLTVGLLRPAATGDAYGGVPVPRDRGRDRTGGRAHAESRRHRDPDRLPAGAEVADLPTPLPRD